MKRFSLGRFVACTALLAIVTPHFSGAAPLTRDLGDGLAYHRITTLPADLPSIEANRKQSLIIDLRFVRGDTAAGTALDAWLKFHPSSRTPVFLLINADTEAAVLSQLARRLPTTGLLVVGTASPGLTPDVVLKSSPIDERKAYDALAAGTPHESLLYDSREKIRDDEASLMKGRQPPVIPLDAPADDPASPSTETDKAAAQKASPPLTDVTLQRAVHLHRALRALKKI
jgi:hypothetical protein